MRYQKKDPKQTNPYYISREIFFFQKQIGFYNQNTIFCLKKGFVKIIFDLHISIVVVANRTKLFEAKV